MTKQEIESIATSVKTDLDARGLTAKEKCEVLNLAKDLVILAFWEEEKRCQSKQ